MKRRWMFGLLGVIAVAFAVYAYQTAKPWVHPIKRADEARIAALQAEKLAPRPVATVEAPPAAQGQGWNIGSPIEWFGPAQVVDGDTLRIEGTELHLWAIDAPELEQSCEKDGKPWRCGDHAKAELTRLTAGRTIACRPEGADGTPQHPTVLCFARETRCAEDAACESELGSLNLAMIERGAAVDVEGHFSDSEEDAREARRGLWASKFKAPWEWRGVEAGH